MKILFVYKYCILGGVTTQLANRLEGLTTDWEVHFLFLYDYGGLSAFGDYEYKYINDTFSFFEDLIKCNQYQVVAVIDTNEVYEWLDKCQYRGMVITEVHTTTDNINQLKKLNGELPMQLMITPSYYMKQLIEEEYAFKGRVPVEVIYDCIEPGKFIPVQTRRIKDQEKIILWVGKLDDHKRWYDFVEICRKLEYEYRVKNLRYVIVGGITAKDKVVDQLIKQVVEKKLVDKMTWYSVMEYEKMREMYAKVYQSGGVYVSTTINESFGMTVLEAMCMKLPIVVPRVGALEELCAPYRDHILYPSQDLDQACELIINQLDGRPQYDTQKYYAQRVCRQYRGLVEKYVSDMLKKRGD